MSFETLCPPEQRGGVSVGVLAAPWPESRLPLAHIVAAHGLPLLWVLCSARHCSPAHWYGIQQRPFLQLRLRRAGDGRRLETAFLVTRLWNSLSLSQSGNVPCVWCLSALPLTLTPACPSLSGVCLCDPIGSHQFLLSEFCPGGTLSYQARPPLPSTLRATLAPLSLEPEDPSSVSSSPSPPPPISLLQGHGLRLPLNLGHLRLAGPKGLGTCLLVGGQPLRARWCLGSGCD